MNQSTKNWNKIEALTLFVTPIGSRCFVNEEPLFDKGQTFRPNPSSFPSLSRRKAEVGGEEGRTDLSLASRRACPDHLGFAHKDTGSEAQCAF